MSDFLFKIWVLKSLLSQCPLPSCGESARGLPWVGDLFDMSSQGPNLLVCLGRVRHVLFGGGASVLSGFSFGRIVLSD